MTKNDKLKVVFILPFNISFGRGGEYVLLNYIKYAPKNVDITVIQTKYAPDKRLTEEELKIVYNRAKFITLDTVEVDYLYKISGKLSKLSKKSIIAKFLNYFIKFIRYILLYIVYFNLKLKKEMIKNKELLKILVEANIIYLFPNFLSLSLKHFKGKLIGSSHSIFLYLEKYSIINSLRRMFILAQLRLYNRYVYAYHLFPGYRKYLKILGIKKCFFVPNGIDTSIFYPKDKKQSDDVIFLFNAALEECKGVLIVIEAWKLMKNKDKAKLYIVGGGMLSDYIKKMSEKYKYKYFSVLPIDKLAEIYRSSDVFLYPTDCDTFSLVMFQALASGLYVLTSNYMRKIEDDSLKNIKREWISYLERDPIVLARKMDEIVENRQEIFRKDRMSLYKFIKENYSWESVVDKFYNELKKL